MKAQLLQRRQNTLDQRNNTQNESRPWYKIPMVWFVMALPLTAVVASIITLVIAAKHSPDVIQHNRHSSKIITPVDSEKTELGNSN